MTEAALPPRTIDGGFVHCDFETWQCSFHSALAGGFDEHHRWPKTMGGPENQDDMLTLCPTHHRRQHALIRAMVEHDSMDLKFTKWFSFAELNVARYAFTKWNGLGSRKPHIFWSSPAAIVRL